MMLGADDFQEEPTLAELGRVLRRLNAQLDARGVHALFLGAQASPAFDLGPERLLSRIVGEERPVADSAADASETLEVLFHYWNALLRMRREGQVALAPVRLRTHATAKTLSEHARRRQEEIVVFHRGLDAGGTNPEALGEEGKRLFRGLAQGSVFLDGIRETLDRVPEPPPEEVREARKMILGVEETLGNIIAGLMEVSDAVRREAMRVYETRIPPVTASAARSPKVGRNEACPCGSGKRWSKCCGAVPVH